MEGLRTRLRLPHRLHVARCVACHLLAMVLEFFRAMSTPWPRATGRHGPNAPKQTYQNVAGKLAPGPVSGTFVLVLVVCLFGLSCLGFVSWLSGVLPTSFEASTRELAVHRSFTCQRLCESVSRRLCRRSAQAPPATISCASRVLSRGTSWRYLLYRTGCFGTITSSCHRTRLRIRCWSSPWMAVFPVLDDLRRLVFRDTQAHHSLFCLTAKSPLAVSVSSSLGCGPTDRVQHVRHGLLSQMSAPSIVWPNSCTNIVLPWCSRICTSTPRCLTL